MVFGSSWESSSRSRPPGYHSCYFVDPGAWHRGHVVGRPSRGRNRLLCDLIAGRLGRWSMDTGHRFTETMKSISGSAGASPGIGRLNWQEVVALADVIPGTFWNEPGIEERLEILKRVNHVFQLDHLPEGSCYDSRYGSLALLAWFLRRWPDGAGSAVAIDLLERWSRAKRNRVSRHLGVPDWNHAWNPGANEIEPAIQARLRELLESAREG